MMGMQGFSWQAPNSHSNHAVSRREKPLPIPFDIEPMRPDDWRQVRRIYEEGIATKQATFETASPDWPIWDEGHVPSCRLVARIPSGQILGWSALSPISRRSVYAGVAEVSVYVARAARGQGVGHRLLEALVEASEAAGFWTLQAGIFPENLASARLHLTHGFRVVGRRERMGQMDQTWRDVLILERRSRLVGWLQPEMRQSAEKIAWRIRRATIADAPAIVDYQRRLLSDNNLFLPAVADDFTMSIADQEAFLARHQDRPNAVVFIADAPDGSVAGLWDAMGSLRNARQHAVEFGMSVDERFRGQGLGAALLQAGLDWARNSHLIHRVELEVYAENFPAITLYQKFGFIVEGRKRRAFLRQGRYADALNMALLLDSERSFAPL